MKIVKLLLVVIPLFMVSQTSHAYNTGDTFTVDGITYYVTDKDKYEVRVTGISSSGKEDIIIPAKIFDGIDQTFTVTSIGIWAEVWSKDMKSLTLSEGITSIVGASSLNYADALETINLPSTMVYMEEASLINLKSLKEINVDENNPKFCSDSGVLYSKDKKELTRFIEYARKKKTRTKQVKTNMLFYKYLASYISFQLLSLFSVDWFLFGTFLFLVCSLIRIIIPTFATEITNKGVVYATSKEADESQRTNPSSDEAVK